MTVPLVPLQANEWGLIQQKSVLKGCSEIWITHQDGNLHPAIYSSYKLWVTVILLKKNVCGQQCLSQIGQ